MEALQPRQAVSPRVLWEHGPQGVTCHSQMELTLVASAERGLGIALPISSPLGSLMPTLIQNVHVLRAAQDCLYPVPAKGIAVRPLRSQAQASPHSL